MKPSEFKTCYDTLFDPIRNYLYYRCGDADLASDIAQEVFLKFWTKQLDFDTNKNKGLLYKMANDLLISTWRKKNVGDNYLNNLELNQLSESPDQTYQYQELKNTYETALAALPEKQRTVFLMNRIEELTYKEIAARLELSTKAVEKRMSLALGFLKQKLIAL